MMKTKDIFIAHPENEEQVSALKAFMEAFKIKFEVGEKDAYKSVFVEKIQQSKEQYDRGEFVCVEKKDLKGFLGIE